MRGIVGIILAFEYDRDGNDFVIRGSLPFLGKTIIEHTYEVLNLSEIKTICVYTNSKGIKLKKYLGNKVKYLVHQNNHHYTTISIKMAFENSLDLFDNLLIIDAQYPLIDEFIINSLMVEHLQNKNDLTYISYIWNNSVIIPNIFIINSELFITLFENRYSNKEINIHNIIELAILHDKKTQFIQTTYGFKVIKISSRNELAALESCFNKKR